MNAACTDFDARSPRRGGCCACSNDSWNSEFLPARTRGHDAGDFGVTVSSGGPGVMWGNRMFWAWACDMRQGFASTRRNSALICARDCASLRHRGRSRKRKEREMRAGRPIVIISLRKEERCSLDIRRFSR